MRITEKNTPILRLLKLNKILATPEDHHDLLRKFNLKESDTLTGEETKREISGLSLLLFEFECVWDKHCRTFGREINVASTPFIEAANHNADRILTPETKKDLLKGLVSGTLLLNDYSISYLILKKNGEYVDSEMIVYKKNFLAFLHSRNSSYVSRIPNLLPDEVGNDPIKIRDYFIDIVFRFLAFRRYADVDIIDAKPFKKVPIPEGEDNKDKTLLVDSTLPVKYYDCSWFRTIVRKEGFLVRGHFRMQPYKNKEREWDHKLIYIEPFQKHGYTRTAKKVVEARGDKE